MADFSLKTQPQIGQGLTNMVKTIGGSFAITTGMVAVGKTTALFNVPRGFVVTGIIAVATDIDTNGAPTLTLSIGDSGSGTRFLSASNIGQAGTSTQTVASTGLLYAFTADTEIIVTATAGAATAAAGTLQVYLVGFQT